MLMSNVRIISTPLTYHLSGRAYSTLAVAYDELDPETGQLRSMERPLLKDVQHGHIMMGAVWENALRDMACRLELLENGLPLMSGSVPSGLVRQRAG